MDFILKKNDIICICGHTHSNHREIQSHNYSAGKCNFEKCNCKNFIHKNNINNLKIKKMETNEKLNRIRLLNLTIFGESKKEDFNENEIQKLQKTSLNEVRAELKIITDEYLGSLYDKCESISVSRAYMNHFISFLKSECIFTYAELENLQRLSNKYLELNGLKS